MASYIRAQATYWRAKAARFRELAARATPGVVSELLKLADDLEANATALESAPTQDEATIKFGGAPAKMAGASTAILRQERRESDPLLDAVHDEGNRQFLTAWRSWRGSGRLIPRRSEINLTEIKQLLGRVILFELTSEDEILVKVAGSQLREHAGFESTGKNFRDLTPPDQWPVRRWRMNQAANIPCGARQVNINPWTRGGNSVALETVTLPIEPDDSAKPRLLISNVAALNGVYDAPAKDRPRLAFMPDEFRFLDLAAGIPNRISP